MNPRGLYRVSGIVSVAFGGLAALSALTTSFLFYGLLLAVPGFLSGVMNIIIKAKYDPEGKKTAKGYYGLLLSSVPLVVLMLFMLNRR